MPWLMKAEPEPRLVNGVDVSFSVEKFASAGVAPWDGVRNAQARNYMRDQMRLGDKVLFYHSSCKQPGVAAHAEVARPGYPDPTAWEAGHPYYDPRSDPDAPRWFQVDLRFLAPARHYVPLAALHHLAGELDADQRADVAFLSDAHLAAIRAMPLLRRSRLSVQPVDDTAYEAICLLADKGHFGAWAPGADKKRKPAARGEAAAHCKRQVGTATAAKRAGERIGDSDASAAPPARRRRQRLTPARIGHT